MPARLLLLLVLATRLHAATYFIEFDPNARALMRTKLAAHVVREYNLAFRGVAVELSAEAANALRQQPGVLAVHEDHRIDRFPTPTSNARATINAITDARARVHASNLSARGQGIVVAVIDSGIDATHPALRNVAGGYDFAQNDPVPEDVEGHGTHVAGIIAANAPDLIGVAPNVTLLAYKVVHFNGDGKESSLVAALERAMDPNGDGDPSDHVDVANISLGWDAGAGSIGSRAVDAATAAGIVVVVAAGNTRTTPAQVKAPGVAPTAITVANAITELEVVDPSSRGPVPGTLAFKPDLAAPGENILSTFRNGGTALLSGTSMSAPHVAGAAALLRELHPDWKPADVKAALVSSTRAMNGPPLATGAGFVDAEAANAAQFVADASGLSFGVDGATTGTYQATRTFAIRNRSAVAATFTATSQNAPNGIAITIAPSSFTLAPNTTRTIEVTLTANNAALTFPRDSLIGGTIRLQSNAATLRVPWGLVRAARATVTYDGAIETLFATSPTRTRLFYQYASGAAETYTAPGDSWDIVLLSDDARVVIAEGVRIDNDEHVNLHAADASRTFALDARDANNTPLHALPQHNVALRMTIDNSALGSDVLPLGNIRELHLSPHSSRFHFAPIETQVDASHVYAAMHPELVGDGGTLTETNFTHARLRWPSLRTRQTAAVIAYESGENLSTIQLHSIAAIAPTLDVFLTTRTSASAFAAASVTSDAESLSLLRATTEGIATGDGRTLSPAAHRAANGSELALGRGPAFPFGTSAYFGGFGETRASKTFWTLAPPPFQLHSRSVAVDNILRGELELVFGDVNLIAPTLTSLRLLDHDGALVDRLDLGENATLRFSAADARTEKTRVSYRAHGALAWTPLALVLEATDIAAGDLYRVDLSSITAFETLIDLRIELKSAAGNRVTWTQAPAFAIGNAALPPRRRSVR